MKGENRSLPGHVPLAVETRGGCTESVHYGSVAVVDATGRLIAAAGDAEALTFTRSTLKPFQALPFMARGGERHFHFSTAQIALMCASHSGEPRHVQAVADMLARAGCGEADLQCGGHRPIYYEATQSLPAAEMRFGAFHNNCSGKHAGWLAWCALAGAPKENYLAGEHPLQIEIRHAVANFCHFSEEGLVTGIDGCSAINYAVPLSRLALGYARLASASADAVYGDAPQRLFAAMTSHPEMVSGEKRIDLDLMRAGAGDWVTKIGAEGVQAIGIRSRGLGLAVKIADGGARALGPVVVAVLRALGIAQAEDARVGEWGQASIINCRGTLTGRVVPIIDLRQV